MQIAVHKEIDITFFRFASFGKRTEKHCFPHPFVKKNRSQYGFY